MRKRSSFSAVLLIAFSLMVVVGVGKANAQQTKKLTFYYVDHGNTMPGYPFWPAYYKGIRDATRSSPSCKDGAEDPGRFGKRYVGNEVGDRPGGPATAKRDVGELSVQLFLLPSSI
jgi:hypothetical protein